MPVYEFVCQKCAAVRTEILKVEQRALSKRCLNKSCNGTMVRQISAPAGFFPGAADWRRK